MKKFIIGNHLTLYLLLACALLAGILAIESHNLLRPEAGNSGNTANAVTPASQARFNPPAMATFSEITERPLFNQSRKPPVPEHRCQGCAKITAAPATRGRRYHIRIEVGRGTRPEYKHGAASRTRGKTRGLGADLRF